jgi:hypothetical protein
MRDTSLWENVSLKPQHMQEKGINTCKTGTYLIGIRDLTSRTKTNLHECRNREKHETA